MSAVLSPFTKNLNNGYYPIGRSPAESFLLQTLPSRLQKQQGMQVLNGKHNAWRYTCISYRVAECSEAPRTADEAGNSPQMIQKHYLPRVEPVTATAWFSILPKPSPEILPLCKEEKWKRKSLLKSGINFAQKKTGEYETAGNIDCGG